MTTPGIVTPHTKFFLQTETTGKAEKLQNREKTTGIPAYSYGLTALVLSTLQLQLQA